MYRKPLPPSAEGDRYVPPDRSKEPQLVLMDDGE